MIIVAFVVAKTVFVLMQIVGAGLFSCLPAQPFLQGGELVLELFRQPVAEDLVVLLD